MALSVLSVALLIFSGSVTGMARQREVNRQSSIAAWAAKNALESLRREEFREVFALFNSDPGDDPGPLPADGNRFAVAGLDPPPGAVDGMHGEILFPVLDNALGIPEVREDLVLPLFGTPRDLSGDSIIDASDHSTDYFLLPVVIRIRWGDRGALRQFDLASVLCNIRMDP